MEGHADAAIFGDAAKTPSDAELRDDAGTATWSSTLCDGSDGLRLFYVSSGYRNAAYGAEVMQGPGYPYLMLNGHCQMYIRDDVWHPLTVKRMSEADLGELAEHLQLSTWPAKNPIYCMPVADGAVDTFGAPGIYWEIAPSALSGCAEPPLGFVPNLQSYVSTIRGSGVAYEGEVAYSLVPLNSSLFGDDFKAASAWPLGAPEASVTDDQTPFRVVDGGEASTLRSLRDRFLSGELGNWYTRYIPVEQPNGDRFELRLRDVSPFEKADGTVKLR